MLSACSAGWGHPVTLTAQQQGQCIVTPRNGSLVSRALAENCTAANSQVVDPWNVQAGADGAIDYDRLVREVRQSHQAANMSVGMYVQRPQRLG